MTGDNVPGWLGRNVLCDELRGLGLPWVPEAWWRRPADHWLTAPDTLEAIAVSSALVRAIRRRGIPCDHELRDAAWRLVVAGLGRLPRDRWPTRRPADEPALEPQAPEAEPERDPDPGPAGEAEPLVIRRRGKGGQHGR